ncbi:putative phenol 2-monooxygenase [Colletotrichum sojae]|uniref:Putative phenol 2-monooxygenase n=1 Tax=Colletotrichum sojae TaxID=2175907 RepID=A0A8H6MT34_9PEZI|nr:putative phenol 2-monooxygenase [Colletotrichum sojae]
MRFPSAQVVRLFDAKVMHLAKALFSDSRWHLVIFGGDIEDSEAKARLQKLAGELAKIAKSFAVDSSDFHSIIHPILVLKSDRRTLDERKIPEYFTPFYGKWGVRCRLNVFVDDESYHDGHGEAYSKYGVDPKVGCMVLIRPDQYVSQITPLDGVGDIISFFSSFLSPATNESTAH